MRRRYVLRVVQEQWGTIEVEADNVSQAVTYADSKQPNWDQREADESDTPPAYRVVAVTER